MNRSVFSPSVSGVFSFVICELMLSELLCLALGSLKSGEVVFKVLESGDVELRTLTLTRLFAIVRSH